jgi:hypothetical protein
MRAWASNHRATHPRLRSARAAGCAEEAAAKRASPRAASDLLLAAPVEGELIVCLEPGRLPAGRHPLDQYPKEKAIALLPARRSFPRMATKTHRHTPLEGCGFAYPAAHRHTMSP